MALVACNKLVEVSPPDDRLSGDVVFTSDATANAAIAGLYQQMMRFSTQIASGAITIYTGLSADELVNTSSSVNADEFISNELSATNPLLRANFWGPGYQLIFQANTIIEGLQNNTRITASLRNQLLGEAYFIRAFSHFYLLQLFGEVPIITATDYRVTALLPRSAASEVYAQVVADLKLSRDLLPVSYVGTGRIRVNKLAATALLSRVYLYLQDWPAAETEAGTVINSGVYSLTANLNNVFLLASNETIWQLMPTSSSANTWEGNLFIPAGTALPLYTITSTLNNAFIAPDARKTAWTKTITVSSVSYTYPYKYKVKTSTTLSEYYVVLRLAELYLIRAEARAAQNKVTLAQADINLVRARAGVGATAAADQVSLRAAVEKERQLELFAEWGHRWFDLKRTGRANAVLGSKPGWQPHDMLYPIPVQELQRNGSLTQNPGY